eukprot:PhF_6_TR39863/c1_g1_i3/m.59270
MVRTFDVSHTRVSSIQPNCSKVNVICQHCLGWNELPNIQSFDCTGQLLRRLPAVIPHALQSLTMDDVTFVSLPNKRDLTDFFQSRISDPLSFLSLQRCQLSGTIPYEAFCVARTLSLRGNFFSGTLPRDS